MAINKTALIKLADLLHTVEFIQEREGKRIFSLDEWIQDPFAIDTRPRDTNVQDEAQVVIRAPEGQRVEALTHTCGTTACAVGFAALDPWFNKRGFKMDIEGSPVFKFHIGWEAVHTFFGIKPSEAHHLFSDHSYDSNPTGPSEVADRIMRFVEDN